MGGCCGVTEQPLFPDFDGFAAANSAAQALPLSYWDEVDATALLTAGWGPHDRIGDAAITAVPRSRRRAEELGLSALCDGRRRSPRLRLSDSGSQRRCRPPQDRACLAWKAAAAACC